MLSPIMVGAVLMLIRGWVYLLECDDDDDDDDL